MKLIFKICLMLLVFLFFFATKTLCLWACDSGFQELSKQTKSSHEDKKGLEKALSVIQVSWKNCFTRTAVVCS